MLKKVALATALVGCAAYAAARVRWGETEPFTGGTYLAPLSHREVREHEEALFSNFKKEHAYTILSSSDHDTIRICKIAQSIVRAARQGLALLLSDVRRSGRQHLANKLDWMERLHWELIVFRDEDKSISCLPGAGKIFVPTGSLHHLETNGGSLLLKTDAEIAVYLAHEVGHVVARHTSRILRWIRPILRFPILRLFVLAYLRRCELEADHIGLLLLAAAGVDPHIAAHVWWNQANMERRPTLEECLKSTHPSHTKRWQFLAQPKVMDEAMELYRQVIMRKVKKKSSHAQG